MSSSRETWQKMVTVVKRAMRMTQPPKHFEERRDTRRSERGLHVEDHFALLVAAGY